MKKAIFSSTAAAVFALGIATASAQLSPKGSGAAALTPEQRSAIRIVIVERLTDEMRNQLPQRLAEAAAALSNLTPDQRAAIRSAISARLGEEIQEGLPQKLGESLAERLGNEVQMPRGATPTPAQRAAIRAAITARLGEELQERVAERLAEAAAVWPRSRPSSERRFSAPSERGSRDEVKDRIGNRLAEEVGDKLSDKTVGSGAK